jgi:hypothetical protein
MKIYFAGSIRGGRENREYYRRIIENLQQYGQVLTEHIGGENLSSTGEDELTDEQIYKRDLSWLKQSDVLVADISIPSLGVGYEIASAEALKKKILCIYRKKNNLNISAMIAGNNNLEVKGYIDLEELYHYLQKFFDVFVKKS